MIALLSFLLTLLVSSFKSKSRLEAENAAFRHQLIVLRRKVRGRAQLTNGDRLFLYQTAETLTHLRHRPRPSKAPISHWTTVRFCNGCPSGGVRSMSQGLRV